jgi:hypothetical protein
MAAANIVEISTGKTGVAVPQPAEQGQETILDGNKPRSVDGETPVSPPNKLAGGLSE